MSDKVKEVAVEEYQQARALTRDAVRSGAYLYPLKGIAYFLSHRSLWKPLAQKLLPTASLGLGVTAFMFAVTYVPQAAVLVGCELQNLRIGSDSDTDSVQWSPGYSYYRAPRPYVLLVRMMQ